MVPAARPGRRGLLVGIVPNTRANLFRHAQGNQEPRATKRRDKGAAKIIEAGSMPTIRHWQGVPPTRECSKHSSVGLRWHWGLCPMLRKKPPRSDFLRIRREKPPEIRAAQWPRFIVEKEFKPWLAPGHLGLGPFSVLVAAFQRGTSSGGIRSIARLPRLAPAFRSLERRKSIGALPDHSWHAPYRHSCGPQAACWPDSTQRNGSRSSHDAWIQEPSSDRCRLNSPLLFLEPSGRRPDGCGCGLVTSTVENLLLRAEPVLFVLTRLTTSALKQFIGPRSYLVLWWDRGLHRQPILSQVLRANNLSEPWLFWTVGIDHGKTSSAAKLRGGLASGGLT